ncbi:MAG: STAS domain-containing protein [Cyclonatronaceae bacterium]
MKYSINERYNCVVFELKGKIMGGPDAEVFRNDLKKLINEGKKNIILDLGKVNFMNSSGIGILIGGFKTMRDNGGDIKLCNADKRLTSLLMVSHLNTVFDTHPSLESAVKAYENQ